jgi:transcriptional regulator with XRE-family HTH domain
MEIAMAAKAGPARRLQLARALIKLRERANLSQPELAKKAGVSKGTVARYERWRDRSGVNWRTVRDLAEACDASARERDAIVRLAKLPGDEGWWSGHSAVPQWMDPLVSMEDWADREDIYANSLVPGLLQTEQYNLAIHQAQEFRRTPEEIEGLVDARKRRQEVLARRDFHLWAVLDEAVLHRIVGDREIMAGQMAHLLEMAEKPNVDVQIMPFDAGATAAGGGHFLILSREDGPGVVFVEMRRQGLYLDEPDELASYRLSFDYIRSQAASWKASKALIESARQEFRR